MFFEIVLEKLDIHWGWSDDDLEISFRAYFAEDLID